MQRDIEPTASDALSPIRVIPDAAPMCADEQALLDVIAGIDAAFDWIDADMRRLQEALDGGITLDVYGELMRVLRDAS